MEGAVDSRWPEVNNSRVAMRRDVSTVRSGRSSCTPAARLLGARGSRLRTLISPASKFQLQESASASGTRKRYGDGYDGTTIRVMFQGRQVQL